MPMIDIYAVAGTFADTKQLAIDAANTVKTIEGVPDIPMFRKNTAAFVHELPAGTLANVDGDGNYVRVHGRAKEQQSNFLGRTACSHAHPKGIPS